MRRSAWAPLLIALFVLALAMLAVLPPHERTVSEAIEDGQDWLLRHQQSDGLWHARMDDPCHAPTVFEVDEALSALALVALEGSARAREARERGVRALLAAQHEDGSFGPPGVPKRRFNWILPSWALVRLAPSDAATRRALHRVEEECTKEDLEDCEGGWALLVFRDARGKGLPIDARVEEGARSAIRRSLDTHANTTSVVPAMATLFAEKKAERITDTGDLHLLFFAVQTDLGDRADARKSLLQAQRSSGCARGSWDPDRWWGSAGGRIYSTSMGLLILRETGER